MKKLLIIVFLSIIPLSSFSQNKKIDSLRTVFNKLNNIDDKAKTLFLIVKTKQKTDFKNSLPIRQEFLTYTEKNNLTKYKYEAYRYLSYFFLRNGILDSVKYYDKKQYQVAKLLDSGKVVSTLQNMGAYYFKKAKLDSSLYYLKNAEKIALSNIKSKTQKDTIKMVHGLIMVKTAITKSLFAKKDYKQALENTYKTLNLADDYNVHDYDLYTYYYLGMINMELKRYEDAISYYQREYELSMKRRKINNRAFALVHLGKAFFESKKDIKKALDYFLKAKMIFDKQGYYTGEQSVRKNLFNVYEYTNQYKKAITVGEKYVQQYLKKQQLDYYLASFYMKLGRIYLLKDNTHKGNFYIEKGLDFAKKHNDEKSIDIFNEAYITFKKENDYKRALQYYEKVTSLRDSLLVNEVYVEKLNELKTKYQTEKKEKQLLQKKEELQNQKLQNQKLIIYSIIISLLSLLIFGVFLISKKQSKIDKVELENAINKIEMLKQKHAQNLIQQTQEKEKLKAKLQEALLPKELKPYDEKEFHIYLQEEYDLSPVQLEVWIAITKGITLQEFVKTRIPKSKLDSVKYWRKKLYSKIKDLKGIEGKLKEIKIIKIYHNELGNYLKS